MKFHVLRRIAPLVLLCFGLQLALAAPAPRALAAPVTVAPPGAPTVEELQAKVAALAANASVPETERKQIQEFYQQALSQLEAAKNRASAAESYRRQQQGAPAEIARLQQSLSDKLPPEPSPKLGAEELSRQLSQAQIQAAEAERRLTELDQQLAAQQARPKNIEGELAELKQKTLDLESGLQAAPSATLLDQARRLALVSQRQATDRQIDLLEQEQLSYDNRLALLNAQRAVAARAVAQTQLQARQLQDLVNARRRDEAAEVVQQADQTAQEVAAKPQVVRDAAALNAALSRQLAELVQQSDDSNARQARDSERLAQLTGRMQGIRQQLAIAGFSDAIGPILLEERRNLPDVRLYRQNAEERQHGIIQARLEQYRIEERLRRARALDESLQELSVQFDPGWSAAQRQTVLDELRPLLAERQQLLEKLGGSYADYIAGMVARDESQRKLSDQAELYGELLDRYLLWIRSSPPLDARWRQGLAEALDWLVAPAQWREVGRTLAAGALQQPLLITLSGALALLLLLRYRRAFIQHLDDRVEAIGDVRRDSFWSTARALAITLLLAAPWPLLLVGLAWLLSAAPAGADFSRGLAQGLMSGAFLTLNITFLRQLCRRRGVAIAHFGWSEAGCRLLRRHLNWFLWIGLPSTVLVRLLEVQPDALHGETLGRAVFCIRALALAFLLWRVLDPRRALLAGLEAGGAAWWLRYLWYPLSVGAHVLLALLALSGYYYTALQLRGRLAMTIWLVVGMVLAVNLFIRWMNISQRRLALQRAFAKREAQLAARANKEAAPASGDAPPIVVDIPDLDLNTIGDQTRSLMNLLVLLGLGFGLWQIWAGLVPAFSILNEITLWRQTVQTAEGAQVTNITLGSIVVAGGVLLLVGFLARNLPGVLELVVLQRLQVDSGNRSAIITICRYLIVATGLVIALDIIGVRWSQVQWLVAALGVGLGFGMQEIFANFISGLILLLERPMRVGDTVTLGDHSGTVSRIHIRATTLVNWDRKEIIVPNKTFITGTLINWTRNDSVTRVVIPVGVTYDSDPSKVHELLLEVATAHPLVLREPAPAVLFLKFGPSALEFEVRVFVRDLANRLTLTHELHNQILEALRVHGIDMPAPPTARAARPSAAPADPPESQAPAARPQTDPTAQNPAKQPGSSPVADPDAIKR
ncbi:MAG: mechanosensitive ion channel [Candidatus Competibacteraceae bacterium]|nr:mechanosensitive ion channel [Candidatus Competibacteraceae bacterium]